MSIKKLVAIALSITSLIISIYIYQENTKKYDIIHILDSYEKVDRIEVVMNDQTYEFDNDQTIGQIKKSFYPSIDVDYYKRNYNRNLVKKVLELEFYTEEEHLFTQGIYTLSDAIHQEISDHNNQYYFSINGLSLFAIAKINGVYYHLSNVESDILEVITGE